jgi:deoxyribodipyrimidine photolyase
MAEKHENLLNIFIVDPWFWEKGDIHENRLNFLLDSLRDLDQNLRAKGSQLTLIIGTPQDVFTKLSPHASNIAWEIDTEPYARDRDS